MPPLDSLSLSELLEQERQLKERSAFLDSELTSLEEQGLAYRPYYQETLLELNDCQRDLQAVQAAVQERRARGELAPGK